MNIKKVAVGLAGVGIIGAIALGNSVAFADDSTSGNQPVLSSTSAPMGQNMGHRGPHHLATAAEFLGLTEEALMTELQTGKTLAEVAEVQGKSVQELIDVLVAEATTKITDMVNNPLPAKPEGFDHRGGHQSEDYDYSGEELSEDGSSL